MAEHMKVFYISSFLLLIGLFCAYGNVEGADWKFYAVKAEGDIKYYYDQESIRRTSKNTVNVSVKRVFINPKKLIKKRKELGLTTKGYKNIDFSLTLKEINCHNKMHRSLSFVDVDRKGNVLNSGIINPGASQFMFISPAMVIDELRKIVCRKNTRNNGNINLKQAGNPSRSPSLRPAMKRFVVFTIAKGFQEPPLSLIHREQVLPERVRLPYVLL
jgi:hypothetical protein